ncbi:MAG: type II/IV secretion system protein [Sedimentisphaerales bacterium]|nr:type II/IV secretion system protein [Sedimentisphaerales bacterium]
MQVLDFIQNLSPSLFFTQSTNIGSASFVTSLPFNPIKLVSLVIWVYLCLFFVQHVQFSLLVPKKYKPTVYIITLLTGPILLFILLIVDTAKKTHRNKISISEILRGHIQQLISSIRTRSPTRRTKKSTIKLLDSSGRSIDEIYGHGDKKQKDNRILDLTEKVIANALERGASDILIDPKDDATYTIRLRIDGVLRTVDKLKADTCKAIVNSIKAVSSMDISEKRRPQDGAFMAKRAETTASFRVASAGVLNGEKLSIRVLNQNAGTFTLADVGLSQKQYSIIKHTISKPSGMVLICGPTGSGKTSTMYAILNEIDRFTHNVITVEDPIEAMLPEASQIEINPKADITFAKALRSILRQDPDVICVGEIRDEETAEIALRASQTGHLVLATIHCDSNATALVRLLDLGVSPLLLSSGLRLLSSQRLLRLLCTHCKKPADLSEDLIQKFKRKGITCTNIFQATGCRRCDGTGYSGRTAVCDLMVISDELKDNIANNKNSIAELRTEGIKKDKSHMRKEALKKVAAGITSLEEIKRVVG